MKCRNMPKIILRDVVYDVIMGPYFFLYDEGKAAISIAVEPSYSSFFDQNLRGSIFKKGGFVKMMQHGI